MSKHEVVVVRAETLLTRFCFSVSDKSPSPVRILTMITIRPETLALDLVRCLVGYGVYWLVGHS
jgi:hypothetical protein